jgi:predicted nucleic acid-binding protein
MTIADTSFIIDLMRKDTGAVRLYEHYEQAGKGLDTTGITALELYKGAYQSADRHSLEKVKNVLSLFSILPIDEPVYEIFGRLSAELRMRGTPLGVFDEVIAAIVLCTDREIITRDRHFGSIPGVKVVSY